MDGWVGVFIEISNKFLSDIVALFGALATAADWVIIPEVPNDNQWREKMCNNIKKVIHNF